MRHYNQALGCFVEIDDIDRTAENQGRALSTQAKHRINGIHKTHNTRFVKSKWAHEQFNNLFWR